VLTDPTQPEVFRKSSAWQSPLLNFQLRVKQTSSSGPAYRSNSLSGNERNRLLISQNGSFNDHSLISGIDASEDSRSFALFDYDNDGWLDIALASTSFPRLRIFRNRFSEIGNHEKGRLVRLNLIGTTSNRDAAGAVVIVHTSKTKRAFRKNLGQGLSSQNSPSIFITVPPKDILEKIIVHWPSGKITNYKPTSSKMVISITE
jgi:enediyne biosynthesis protein E4